MVWAVPALAAATLCLRVSTELVKVTVAALIFGAVLSKAEHPQFGMCDLEPGTIGSDPSALEQLKLCPALTGAQQDALNALLLSGRSEYGDPSSWDLQTLRDLGPLVLALNQTTLSLVAEAAREGFRSTAASSITQGHSPRDKSLLLPGAAAASRPRLKRSSDRCQSEPITADSIFEILDLSLEQLDLCLSNDVLIKNLEDVVVLPIPLEMSQVLKKKVDEAFPSGLPEQQLRRLGTLSRHYTGQEISRWPVTSSDTLSALLSPSGGDWNDSQVQQLISRYLALGGSWTGPLLQEMGGKQLCQLQEEQIQQIPAAAIGTAGQLDISTCSQAKKEQLYGKAREAFASLGSSPSSYYCRIRPYLGGAPAEDLKDLANAGVAINMDLHTFLALNPEELQKLSVMDVKRLLGENLPELKEAEHEPSVESWVQKQSQQELDCVLGIGLQGGQPAPAGTASPAPAPATGPGATTPARVTSTAPATSPGATTPARVTSTASVTSPGATTPARVTSTASVTSPEPATPASVTSGATATPASVTSGVTATPASVTSGATATPASVTSGVTLTTPVPTTPVTVTSTATVPTSPPPATSANVTPTPTVPTPPHPSASATVPTPSAITSPQPSTVPPRTPAPSTPTPPDTPPHTGGPPVPPVPSATPSARPAVTRAPPCPTQQTDRATSPAVPTSTLLATSSPSATPVPAVTSGATTGAGAGTDLAATTVPNPSSAPTATPVPNPSSSPTATAVPNPSSAVTATHSTVTTIPNPISSPTVTPIPHSSPAATVTSVPSPSSAPTATHSTVTSVPKPSSSPTATPAPKPCSSPTVTPVPNPSSAVTATHSTVTPIPNPSSSPTVTPVPNPSSAPAATPVPQSPSAPAATTAPHTPSPTPSSPQSPPGSSPPVPCQPSSPPGSPSPSSHPKPTPGNVPEPPRTTSNGYINLQPPPGSGSRLCSCLLPLLAATTSSLLLWGLL